MSSTDGQLSILHNSLMVPSYVGGSKWYLKHPLQNEGFSSAPVARAVDRFCRQKEMRPLGKPCKACEIGP